MPKAKWTNFSTDEIKSFAKESVSKTEFVKKMGYSGTGGNVDAVVKNIISTIPDLDLSHFLGQGSNKNNYDMERFKNGNKIKNGDALRVLKFIRGCKCEQCGLTEWNNQPIPLEVHHLDGDHYNNDLSNIILLCPNCHALTSNWRRKNINKPKISDEEFIEALKNSTSIRQALLKLKLTAAGANYERAYKLIEEFNIEHLK